MSGTPGASGLRTTARSVLAAVLALAVAACGGEAVTVERAGGAAPLTAVPATEPADTTVPATTAPPPAAQATPATPATPPPPPAEPAPTPTAPRPHELVETGFSPYATVEQVTLVHPAAVVERVGFHESNHDGARQQEPAATAARPVTLESRERGTGNRTAADIVVPPDTEIRSPVTGTVKRAGGYVLYCEHRDDFAVIEPDARPGWEVKVLHIDGVLVRAGQRVESGVTVIAPRPTILPFASQVEDHTGTPPWPHVHVEVVDPSIPDRPSPGGSGC